MISWDLVMALAQAELGVFILPTLLNKRAYMPRLTSGGMFTGLTVVTVALLVGFQAPLSAAIAAAAAVGWALVFVFRGKAPKEASSEPRP